MFGIRIVFLRELVCVSSALSELKEEEQKHVVRRKVNTRHEGNRIRTSLLMCVCVCDGVFVCGLNSPLTSVAL